MPTSVDATLWLSELQAKGLIKGVGLTNFDVPHMLKVGERCPHNKVWWNILL